MNQFRKHVILLLILSCTFFFKECNCKFNLFNDENMQVSENKNFQSNQKSDLTDITLSSGFPAPLFDLKIMITSKENFFKSENYVLTLSYKLWLSIMLNFIFIVLVLYTFKRFKIYENRNKYKTYFNILIINIIFCNLFLLLNLNSDLIMGVQIIYNFFAILISGILTKLDISYNNYNVISRIGFILNFFVFYFVSFFIMKLIKKRRKPSGKSAEIK